MASFPSTELPDVTLSWARSDGTPMPGPREWEGALLLISGIPAPWSDLNVRCNAAPLAVAVRQVDGRVQVTAEWPRANAGHYQLQFQWPGGILSTRVTVFPAKLTSAQLERLLEDLHTGLPASVALALHQAGALAGTLTGQVKPATLEEELSRLRRAVLGTGERPPLRVLLGAVQRDPHVTLEALSISVRREYLRRPSPAALVRAVAGHPVLPPTLKLPDERVNRTVDVYENRVALACIRAIDRRLRHLADLRPDLTEVTSLQTKLQEARHAAPILNEVSELRVPPTRVTMVLLRRPDYRALLEVLLELQHSAQVTLDDVRLLEPLNNVPALYQTWCTLQIMVILMALCAQHGFELAKENVLVSRPGSLLVRILPDGVPILVFQNPVSGTRITLTSERLFCKGSGAFRSISFSQRPDLTIEVQRPGASAELWLFDPKYKLNSDLPGQGGDGRPVKEDIDKMHAYRDAIRTREGVQAVRFAAILYPGRTTEYAPGLAALSSVPGDAEALRVLLSKTLSGLFHPLAGLDGDTSEALRRADSS